MSIERVTWMIEGRKLVQANPHQMWAPPEPDEGVKPARRKKGLRGSDSEAFETARKLLYVNEEGQYYHPAIAFWKVLLMACHGRKFGSLNALTAVTRGVALMEEEFILYDPTTLQMKRPKLMEGDEWQIDFRRAVNHNKKTEEGGVGIVVIRPMWKKWGGFLTLEVDVDHGKDDPGMFKSVDVLTYVLNVAGHQFGAGVGSMRIKAIIKQTPQWSGFGAGKFWATLM